MRVTEGTSYLACAPGNSGRPLKSSDCEIVSTCNGFTRVMDGEQR